MNMQHAKQAVGEGVDLRAPFEAVLEKTREALAAERFGILSQIDVKATLKAKLDVEFPPFMILGACFPPMAHRSLTINAEMGLLMPCNVVVRQLGEGTVRVEAVNVRLLASLFPEPEMAGISEEVGERLRRVLKAVEAGIGRRA